MGAGPELFDDQSLGSLHASALQNDRLLTDTRANHEEESSTKGSPTKKDHNRRPVNRYYRILIFKTDEL